jgi:4-amino-4-deoxy-L-arabinose transferase-like glycosyltransferase
LDNSKTPIIILNLIPRITEQLLYPGKHKSDFGTEDILRDRYITLVVSLLVIIVVYVWAKELYGTGAGLFGAFLMAMNPNIIALAGLVTTDAYSFLFLLLPFYFLWKTVTRRSFTYFIFFSLAVAFAQLTKPSLFHLYILVPVILRILKNSFFSSIFSKTG